MEYLDSAETILKVRGCVNPQGSFYCLVSHAFELFAKAYLKVVGLGYGDLKKIGHNPKFLIQKCIDSGLPVYDNDVALADVFYNLNKHDMQRYPMLGFFTIGPADFIIPTNLIVHVRDFHERVSSVIGVKKNAAN